jgi:hypothetical protein
MKLRVLKQDNQDLRLAVDGINADFIHRYKVLARSDDGDKILKNGFEACTWSLMRIFIIVQIDSRDDDDLGIAEEVSKEIARYIRNWLRKIPLEERDGLRNFELGGLALQLGGKHQIPLVNRQHSMHGILELAYLRTFYSSAGMPGVVDLEFESVFDREKQSEQHEHYHRPISKIMITLCDGGGTLAEEMEMKGISQIHED